MSNYGFDPNAQQPFNPMGHGQYYQPTADDRTWGMLAHLSPIVLGFIGPLVIWLIYKEKSPFVADQAKEALNFSLSVMIVGLLLIPTCIGPTIVGIGGLVYGIMAGLEANKGVWYRYEYIFRMIT
jgi:uncharacterized Tic20 family protein